MTRTAITITICCQPCKSGHIAVLSPNNFKSLSIYLAVLCSDKTLVPVDWELPFVEIINILNHSDCDTVFFDSAYTELFLENKKQLPKLKNYICLQMKEHEEHDGICSYDRLVEKGQTALAAGEESFLSLRPGEKDDRLIFYKNGTVEAVEVKHEAIRKNQRDYIYRRRLFIDNVARPNGWRFTEYIKREDKKQ